MTGVEVTLLTKDINKRTLAFKLTVKREEKDKVFDPDFWPILASSTFGNLCPTLRNRLK